MNRITCLAIAAAMAAGMVFGADPDTKSLNDEAAALMKEKSWQAAGEKFIEAAKVMPAEPRKLAGGFEQAVKTLGTSKNTNEVAQAIALAENALAIPGLSSVSRTKIQHLRIQALTNCGRKQEALALVQDMLDARIDVVATAALGANAAQAGTPGRDERFRYLERILDNPDRYGLEGKALRKLIGEYAGEPRAWGGDVLERRVLEKAEAYTVKYAKYGLEQWTPKRLKAIREMDSFPLSEKELNIPNGLKDFGFDPNRKVVHAKDFGWNPTNATECLTKAFNSDASTVIVDDMGSPWYTRSVKISKEHGSNQQIIFKKGVKIHAVTQPTFEKGDLICLQDVTNIVFIGEGELGKDVYIGQFPSREARFATGISYAGSGFGGKGRNVLLKNIWSANNLDDGFCMHGNHHYLVDCLMDNNFRQGLSIVYSDHCVYKNVTFIRTVGGEPHCGIDVEPPYEVYPCPFHYFFNCRFEDNAAGSMVLSTSNYDPVTLYFKDCFFGAGRYRNISTVARLGIYVGPVQKAPSKIIFDDCTIEGYADASALFWNTMIFDMWFNRCTFNDLGHLDPTRKPNMSPILLGLDRAYWDGFYPKPGVVTFEDCKFNGWEGKPLIAVEDRNGKVGINSFRGIVDHNGQKIDLSKFSYLPAERTLKNADDPDLKTLDVAASADSCTPGFDVDFAAPWYDLMPAYQYYFKGEKGKTVTLNFTGTGKFAGWTLHLRKPSGAESEIGKINPGENSFPVAIDETGVHMVYGTYKGDGSESCAYYRFSGAKGASVAYAAVSAGNCGRRLQLKTAADAPRAVGYFEVAGGKPLNIKIMGGGIEILDETTNSVIKLDEGDYFGTKTFALNPKKDAIWSFRALTPRIYIRFFAPYTGLFAETPEALPVTKANLAFAKVEPVPAPELKDEPPLPLPEKYTNEVAMLVADRLAWAKPGNEAKRLAEAEASLARLKQHANDDGTKREIDDVTRTVQRLTHSAKAEAQILKETPEEAAMAALCAKYATVVAPEWMWMVSLKDGIFTYPDQRSLRSLYNEIVRRLEK